MVVSIAVTLVSIAENCSKAHVDRSLSHIERTEGDLFGSFIDCDRAGETLLRAGSSTAETISCCEFASIEKEGWKEVVIAFVGTLPALKRSSLQAPLAPISALKSSFVRMARLMTHDASGGLYAV